MANQKVSHLRAKLKNGSVGQTFDIYDENALHDTVNNLTTSTTGNPLDAAQGPVISSQINNISTSLSSEASRASAAENALSSRMDAFTKLPSGSTSGDAELIDIRTGDSGIVYGNAGTAVRSQVASLKESLSNVAKTVAPIYENKVTLTATSERYKYTLVPYQFKLGKTYRVKVSMDVPAPERFGISTSNTYTYVDSYVAYFPKGDIETTFILKPTANAAHLYLMLSHTSTVNYTVEIETCSYADVQNIANTSLVEVPLSDVRYQRGWIRYSNGELVGSEGTKTFILTKQDFPTYIKAKLTSNSDSLAAIAFYSTDNISTDGYMQSSSVQFYPGDNFDGIWYSATVPDGCKIMTITTIRKDALATVADPVLLRPVTSKKHESEPVFLYKPCYDHLFVNYGDDDIVIPHESLYHIRISRRLGFNMFELNVARTSDGVFVVNHFRQKKFGNYFHHVDGSTDISSILVSDVTWEWIVNNVRYNSTIPKYRTRPCRLEEALAECKQQDLTPLIEISNADIVGIADSYMGKGNYVAYGATRTECPDATLFDGANYTNIDDIINYCDGFKPPFIYSLLNMSSFTDSELKTVASELHKRGYKLATSYNDLNWYKLRSIGFDINGTQLLMNRIDNGNICNYESIFGFSKFNYTNATESDGALTFNSDGTISPIMDSTIYDVCGFDVELWFTGTITIPAIGEYYGGTYESDGSLAVYVAVPIINGSPNPVLTCASGTTISDIKFKASVF